MSAANASLEDVLTRVKATKGAGMKGFVKDIESLAVHYDI